MDDIKQILVFGWPYLRRYRLRLVLGVLLGMAFGAANASFLWATKTLFDRLEAKPKVQNEPFAAWQLRYFNSITSADAALDADPDGDGSSNLFEYLTLTNPLDRADARALSKEEQAQGVQLLVYPSLSREKESAQESAQKPDRFGKIAIAKIKTLGSENLDRWLPQRGRTVDWRQALGGLLFLPTLVFLRGYIGYLSSYFMGWVGERVIRDIKMDLHTKLQSLSLDYFNLTPVGQHTMLLNNGANSIYRCLSLGFSDAVKEPFTIVATLTTLFVLDRELALLGLVFAPLTLLPITLIGRKIRRIIKSSYTVGTMQDSLIFEVYANIKVIKAFCLERAQLNRFAEIYRQLLRIGMKTLQAKELLNPVIELISVLALGLVILFVFYTNRSPADLVTFLTGMVLLYTPIKKLGGIHVYFAQAGVIATMMLQTFKLVPTVQQKPQALRIQGFHRQLAFEKVDFAYIEKPVIKKLSLVIPRGEKLGIAGESGSGKSTLANLIFRFYDPNAGAVTIDGVDLKDVTFQSLREQMALVSQEVVIFDQTAAENIGCGKMDATQEEIEAAARAADAHEFIMHLPQGYETRLGERGVTLSGGQRQRIVIARAFIRNTPILVLDEATASLDSKSEAEVQGALDRLAQNRTVVSIAHRLSTLASMDRVVVFSNGQIVEEGTFPDLLRRKGAFAAMAAKQGIFG